jgi:hypothetical protein
MAEHLPHLNIKTRYDDKPRSKAGKAEVAKLKQILATWVKNGVLHVVTRRDEKRRDREYFAAAAPVPPSVIYQPHEEFDECST